MSSELQPSTITKACPKCHTVTESWASICQQCEYEWPDKHLQPVKPFTFIRLVGFIALSSMILLFVLTLPVRSFILFNLLSYAFIFSSALYVNCVPRHEREATKKTKVIFGSTFALSLAIIVFISFYYTRDIAIYYYSIWFKVWFSLIWLYSTHRAVRHYFRPTSTISA